MPVVMSHLCGCPSEGASRWGESVAASSNVNDKQLRLMSRAPRSRERNEVNRQWCAAVASGLFEGPEAAENIVEVEFG